MKFSEHIDRSNDIDKKNCNFRLALANDHAFVASIRRLAINPPLTGTPL
jgi:hypothetical protein